MHDDKWTTGNKATHSKALREAGTGAGRYYASFRGPNGTARRQRFTKDRKESEQLYRRWVVEHYDDTADIVIRDGSGFKGDMERTLPYIANAFVRHDEGRVRLDGAPRTKGTISLRVLTTIAAK